MSIQDPPVAAIGSSLECGASSYRFSIDQYHQMIATGILAEDERVQLLEGEIVRMTPSDLYAVMRSSPAARR